MSLNDLEWPLTQISRSWYYSTSNNSKTVQDRAIFVLLYQQKVVHGLSNGAIFNDLERPLHPISSSRYSLTLNIWEMVRDADSFNEILTGTCIRPTQQCHFEWPWVTLSDLAKYANAMTRSIASPLCDSRATCSNPLPFNLRGHVDHLGIFPQILTQTAQLSALLHGAETLPKMLTLWVDRNNVTDDRQQTDDPCHKANVT